MRSSGKRMERPSLARRVPALLALATIMSVSAGVEKVQALTEGDEPIGVEAAGGAALAQAVPAELSSSERLSRMVKDHLERLRGNTWSRLDILGAKWVNGEPPEGAGIGPLHGTAEPTANGTILLYADVVTRAGTPLRLPVQATVRPWVRVPVAARDLHRGDPLDSGNVRIEERSLADLRGARPADEAVAAGGMRVRRDLDAGEILTAISVEVPFLVRSGEKVEIRYRDGSIHLSTKGIARRPGRAGETIPVENANSKRTILASVVAERTVEVRP
jgi:flagella basal body P-ring formation protein FlgA